MNRESERKRLVELLRKGIDKHESTIENYVVPIWEFLADHLLDNGIVVPPVKVGDYIWFLKNDKLTFGQVEDITIARNELFAFVYEVDAEDEVIGEWTVPLCDIGKTVFTSREDAEKALEGEGE